MYVGHRLKIGILLAGDIAALYLSLILGLVVRYSGSLERELALAHLSPFTTVFALWIVVFYISGLYDLRQLRNNLAFLKSLGIALLVNAGLAIGFFYLTPFAGGITPRRNLFLFIIIFIVIELVWRRTFNRITASGDAPNQTLIIGDVAAKEITSVVNANPQLGYRGFYWSRSEASESHRLSQFITDHRINLTVVPRDFKRTPAFAKELYQLLGKGIDVVDVPDFYETVFRKVPLEDVEETWFLEHIPRANPFYEVMKRSTDLLFALLLFIVSLPLWPLITLLVISSSPGPIIYRQTRIGRRGVRYTHYKFRTMPVHNAKTWPTSDDARITPTARFLRRSHLDELPQVINIIRGDLAFVGPRPDFVDYYERLEEQIPYYSIRTLITPGLTGWAQVNYPVTASLEETKERLAYDLYYIKNRSLALDILVVLRTIRTVLTGSGI